MINDLKFPLFPIPFIGHGLIPTVAPKHFSFGSELIILSIKLNRINKFISFLKYSTHLADKYMALGAGVEAQIEEEGVEVGEGNMDLVGLNN
jgi:hypothetical protein